METWKSVTGFEGLYEVSDLGRVRRASRSKGFEAGRLVAMPESSHGYLRPRLWKGGAAKRFHVHQLVALAFIGPRPAGFVVNHKDGNKLNNRLENLEYVTPSENTRHGVANGLHPRGERCGTARITEWMAMEIRRLDGVGVPRAEIARRLNTAESTVRDVASGKSWKHLLPA